MAKDGEVTQIEKLLSFIQRNIKVPKSQYNKFGKYYYRNAEDILRALTALLPEDATASVSDEIVLVGDRYYVQATASISYMGGVRTTRAYARESLDKKGMDESQITGSASSYARKYALNGLLLIDDTKDADSEKPPKPKSNNPIAEATGGGMKDCMDEEATQNAYDTAIKKLNACKSLVELRNVSKPYLKQGVFSAVQWGAIIKLKDKLKVKLPNVEEKQK